MSKGRAYKRVAPSDNYYRRIRRYIVEGDIELTEREQEVMDRYVDLYGLVKRYGQNRQVILRAYRQLKKGSDDVISDIHIWNETSNAMKLFGNVDRVNKEVLQTMVIDDLYEDMTNMNTLMKMALEMKDGDGNKAPDVKTYERISKLKSVVLKNLIEASGINKVNPDMPDFSKLEKHDYNISTDPVTKQIMKQLVEGESKGVLDLGAYFDEAIIIEAKKAELQEQD